MSTRFTPNLKLRVADTLTADATYNLERIDLLGSVFPLTSDGTTVIASQGDLILSPESEVIIAEGDLKLSGKLVLTTGPHTLTLQPATQTSNVTLTLPPNTGTAGQFLSTDGTGAMSWQNLPTLSLDSLSDVTVSTPAVGDLLQFNGSQWVNIPLPVTRNSNSYTWVPAEGATKTLVHNFNTTNIIVWVYDPVAKCQILLDEIEYSNPNTVILRADDVPPNNYIVHLIQAS